MLTNLRTIAHEGGTKLVVGTLSDGSKVYNVIVEENIGCVDYAAAYDVFAGILKIKHDNK